MPRPPPDERSACQSCGRDSHSCMSRRSEYRAKRATQSVERPSPQNRAAVENRVARPRNTGQAEFPPAPERDGCRIRAMHPEVRVPDCPLPAFRPRSLATSLSCPTGDAMTLCTNMARDQKCMFMGASTSNLRPWPGKAQSYWPSAPIGWPTGFVPRHRARAGNPALSKSCRFLPGIAPPTMCRQHEQNP